MPCSTCSSRRWYVRTSRGQRNPTRQHHPDHHQVSDDPVKTDVVTITSKKDESHPMRCVTWQGTKSVQVETRPKPLVTDARDAIIKVTTAAICGSDLHLYTNAMPGMHKGDVLGHEAMGIVESVGPEIKDFKPGDRVVVPFDIACGSCFFCEKQLFSGVGWWWWLLSTLGVCSWCGSCDYKCCCVSPTSAHETHPVHPPYPNPPHSM